MTINFKAPDIKELKPRILVMGVGGAGGNAINEMIENNLQGVEFIAVNTDAQDLKLSKAKTRKGSAKNYSSCAEDPWNNTCCHILVVSTHQKRTKPAQRKNWILKN